jgi:hypothetical protein
MTTTCLIGLPGGGVGVGVGDGVGVVDGVGVGGAAAPSKVATNAVHGTDVANVPAYRCVPVTLRTRTAACSLVA